MRALSLIEVVLATGLIAIAGLALIGIQIQAARQTKQSRQYWAASQLAKEALGHIQEMSMDLYPAGDVVFKGVDNEPPTPNGFPPMPYPKATRGGVEYFVTVRHEQASTRSHQISVNVTWGERGLVQMATRIGP